MLEAFGRQLESSYEAVIDSEIPEQLARLLHALSGKESPNTL